MKKKLIYILTPILVLILLLAGAGLYAYSAAKSFLPNINTLQATGEQLKSAFQSQDLVLAKAKTQELATQVEELNTKYSKYTWAGKVPFFGYYVNDGQYAINASRHLVSSLDTLLVSVEPYADLLGFTIGATEESKLKASNKPQTIEDRIVFMAQTLDKISPDLDKVAVGMESAQKELDKIDANRYPDEVYGKSVRSKVVGLKSAVSESAVLLSQAKPLIKLFPELLGNPNSKTYMVLLQNDAELRATGGFMTAYAFLRVTKGKIEPLASYNIYDLDDRFNKKVPAPEPIKKYLNETYLNLRNINLSPDFKVSMDEFYKYYRDISGMPKIDGIIAIDTKFPVEILKIIGPIGVGGWGNFGPQIDKRCDCPQVVYALEDMITKPVAGIRPDRKAVLGPLMHSMMANAMGSPKHTWPKLLNVGLTAIKEKHLIFYFMEDKTQLIAEDFNAAGRIKDYTGDYLHINDSNFGGAKTDMFITREVEQEITNENGVVTKTVSISYNNPRKGDNCNLEAGQLCLNGVYRDYVRLYVPKGSKLLSVVGSEVKEQTTEELGKTVFDAFFTMRPQSQSKIVFKYELPQMDLSTYKLLVQKQPGINSIKHTVTYNGNQTVFELREDKELVLN